MMADHVLHAPARPLATAAEPVPDDLAWSDIFPETPSTHRTTLALVWGPWSAHSPDALADLQRARDFFRSADLDVDVMHAVEPGSRADDAQRLLERHAIDLPAIPLSPERFWLTEGHNQNPTILLFRDGRLLDRRLGAQTFDALRAWVLGAAN